MSYGVASSVGFQEHGGNDAAEEAIGHGASGEPRRRRKKGRAGRKAKSLKAKKRCQKASFKVNGRSKGGLKAKKAKQVKKKAVRPSFKGYDLSGLPRCALPDSEKENAGSHSYTLTGGCGARIECLLKHQAFFVKRTSSGPGPLGQVAFSKFGGAHGAWLEAVRRSGYKA